MNQGNFTLYIYYLSSSNMLLLHHYHTYSEMQQKVLQKKTIGRYIHFLFSSFPPTEKNTRQKAQKNAGSIVFTTQTSWQLVTCFFCYFSPTTQESKESNKYFCFRISLGVAFRREWDCLSYIYVLTLSCDITVVIILYITYLCTFYSR